jgi:aldehyde dehydrogenase
MIYAQPNTPDAKVQFKARYDNFIGGQWVAPVSASIST